jgi:O-antigen/teichoic acid export membrane protein
MSVQGSFAATLASRVYLTLLSILMLPLYLRHMGLEAYGLIALFLVLQMWFQLLDVGLTPTLAREAARYRAGALTAHDFRLLMRAMEGVFWVLSAMAAVTMFLASDAIARRWLQSEHLTTQDVAHSLRLMAPCIALRLLSEMYRGVISGLERLVWLAGFNAALGTLRLVLVLPYLVWVDNSPAGFFSFQLAALLLETGLLIAQAYRRVPSAHERGMPWRPQALARVLGFSVVMSLASVLWITVSQLDKLLLSGLLSLSDYGAFSLAVTAASAVLLVSGALSEVLLPRLSRLHGQGAQAELQSLYRSATQWACLSACSVASVLAFHAERVLWIWSGNAELAARAAPMLSLYALGNAALAVGAFPYYLQFAAGRLRLHLVGTALMVAGLVPGLIWASGRFGAVGAAATWLAVNVLYLLLWTPVAHARFMPRLHGRWLAEDVLPAAALAAVAALGCLWLPWPADRLGSGVMAVAVALVALLSSAAGSSSARAMLKSRMRIENTWVPLLHLVRRATAAWPVNAGHLCCICGRKVRRFLPYRGFRAGMPPVLTEKAVIGSDIDNYECPACCCHDRERHLFLYLQASGLLSQLGDMRILHIAPERQLRQLIAATAPREYVLGDLYPAQPDIRRIDLMDVDFPSASFDLVIANHVLEHVADDLRALTEILRVLRPGGHAILQTPYASRLATKFEDASITTDAERLQAYGQEDHCRLYGADFIEFVAAVGLRPMTALHETLLPGVDARRMGVNAKEPFMLFGKPER